MSPRDPRPTEQGERGEVVPTADPDTPPDSADPTGPCPRCGRVSNFEVVGSIPVTFGGPVYRGGGYAREEFERVSALLCAGCEQATVVIEEKWIGTMPARVGMRGDGLVAWRGVHWWPPPSSADLDESIPEPLRDAYAEAMRCLGSRAPRAAVAMLRRTLEGLVRDRGSADAVQALDRNLAAALRVMADEHTLDANLAEWAREIRLTANVGAHFDPLDDVGQGEAEDLARLTRQLLHYVYELPAMLRRSRER